MSAPGKLDSYIFQRGPTSWYDCLVSGPVITMISLTNIPWLWSGDERDQFNQRTREVSTHSIPRRMGHHNQLRVRELGEQILYLHNGDNLRNCSGVPITHGVAVHWSRRNHTMNSYCRLKLCILYRIQIFDNLSLSTIEYWKLGRFLTFDLSIC